jgi:hypothetical protein
VKDGTGLRAVEVSCGGFHTMVLMEDGSVYAMGKQDFGMLGTGTELSVSIDIGVEAPTLVQYSPATSGKAYKKPVRATHVTTGGWHTAIINARGALYMCGKGEYGRLGLGDEKSRMGLTLVCAPQYVAVPSSINAPLLPTVVEHASSRDSTGPRGTPVTGSAPAGAAATTPGQVADLEHPDPSDVDRVVAVSAGGSHTVWATAAGKVYAVGRVDGGRLGMGYPSPSNPVRIGGGAANLNKKGDRLLQPVDITPLLYTCCAGQAKCVHRVAGAAGMEARGLPCEKHVILQVAAGGSHSAVLVDFPDVTEEGAFADFLQAVTANILCEEARIDPAQIPKVK